jgi:hypothetical protein
MFRVVLAIRAALAAVMLIFFVGTWFSGSVAAIVVFGLLFLWLLGGLLLRFYLYSRFDPALRAEPIDAKLLPSMRYLMPKKYPYTPDDASS